MARPRRRLRSVLFAALCAAILAPSSNAESLVVQGRFPGGGGQVDPPLTTEFQMLGPAVRGVEGPQRPGSRLAATTASTSIATDGTSAFVADPDSGSLVRTDRDGKVTGRTAIRGAAQVAVIPHRDLALVTDRSGDRLAAVRMSSMKPIAWWKTPAEPYGLAVTPDGSRALVTTIADHQLAILDTARGTTLRTIELLREPRGVAVSPDGREATITFTTAGVVAMVDLQDRSAAPRYVPIGRPASVATVHTIDAVPQVGSSSNTSPARPISKRPRRHKRRVFRRPQVQQGPVPTFARGAFATAYLRNAVAVVPYQRSTPVQTTGGRFESRGTYGGGGVSSPPIVHRLAFVSPRGKTSRAHVDVRVPRALAYDSDRDLLYVAGKGDDKITLIAEASQDTAHFAGRLVLRQKSLGAVAGKGRVIQSADAFAGRCGPGGLALDGQGELLVHCTLSQKVVRVSLQPDAQKPVARGDSFGGSRLSREAQIGRELFFRAGDRRMTGLGAFACASCHPDGRSDGLSWRIQGATLQTPMLRGRLEGTHPFKWDGQDADLKTSLSMTVRRLGGTGINAREVGALRAFLRTQPAPRSPSVRDAAAVARGEKLFHSDAVGCASCHGGPRLTNRQSYQLASDLPSVDTPSLLGLAHSAPYYHDGSAATLEALLLENGSIHGMGRVGSLKADQRSDLIAFLETL